MTPQERQLVDELFERLSRLEGAPRDADATAVISQGLARAPNAIYPLVQTVLLQEEALKRANARIEELEGGAPPPQEQPGFLDSMRNSIFGQPSRGGGSVPSVRAGGNERPAWNTGAVYPGAASQQPQPDPRAGQGGAQGGGPGPAQGGGFGGSFLGTAAATAAGVIGGSMLMNSIGNLMGGNKHGFGDTANAGKSDSGSPWSGGQSKDDLSREAGVNDIGRSGANDDSGSRQSFSDQGSYDQASNESDDDDDSYDDDDDYDLDGGDSDFA